MVQLGDYHLRIPLISTLVVVVLVALLVSLGMWQLERAELKRDIARQVEARQASAASALPLQLEAPADWRHRLVRLSGRFDARRVILLDNQVLDGQVGVNVLVPFNRSAGGLPVLVDLGWVPLPADRALPDVSGVPAGGVSITGRVYVPYGEGYRMGAMDEGQAGWPRLVQYLDFDALGERLGHAVAPLTVRLDPAEPLGFRRQWHEVEVDVNRHIGYAVQWFALAAVLLVIYLAMNMSRADRAERDRD